MTKKIKENQQFCKLLMDLNPDLVSFWDFENNIYKKEEAANYSESCSLEEGLLLSFGLMVWLSGDINDFDLSQAIKHLKQEQLDVIRDWIME
jgi:hypothetical protein